MPDLFQTLDQVAGNVQADLGLSPDRRYLIRNKLIDFVYYFRTMIQAEIRVKQVNPVPHSLTIPFPEGYMGFDKVGWVVNGTVHLVASNPNIAKILSLSQPGMFLGGPTAPYNYPGGQQVSNGSIEPYTGYGGWVGSGGTGAINGAPIRELDGYFMEDWDNKVLRLSSYNTFPNIYWTYATSCVKPSAEICIHPHAYLCAKAWAKYYYLLDAYKTPVFRIEIAQRELDVAILEMKRLIHGLQGMDYLTFWDKAFGYLD